MKLDFKHLWSKTTCCALIGLLGLGAQIHVGAGGDDTVAPVEGYGGTHHRHHGTSTSNARGALPTTPPPWRVSPGQGGSG